MSEHKDICSALFTQPCSTEQARPAGGRLLVAEPFMDETIFSHSVVSLLDYEPEGGAMGVVLNRQSHSMLTDLIDDLEIEYDMPVFCGGPLAMDRVFFIHTLGSDIIPGAREYMPGLYIGGDFDAMIEYINSGYRTDGVVRFFVGYSSWDRSQLESEIAEGAWALTDAPADGGTLLSGSGDSVWHRTVRSMGNEYRSWRLVPRHVFAN
ncbi:MAG: YqgE/AlgH family protein [Muribaculaceae bacterium]|nr:YqgE/AlgH family protein [Muribaculaceae bacterium]